MGKAGFTIIGLIMLTGCLASGRKGVEPEPLAVSSPDGNLTLALETRTGPGPSPSAERLGYRVTYKGAPVIEDSWLGLDFVGSGPLDRDLEVLETVRASRDATWENRFGARHLIPDRYHQLTVSLRERQEPGRRMDLVLRAYDEGVAFRYFLPEQEAMEAFLLAAENSEFRFPRGASAYALDMGRFNTHYEGEYHRIPLDDVQPESIINLPLLVELPGGPWAALLEADLTDYAGLYVGGMPGAKGALRSKLSPLPAAPDRAVVSTLPKATPWRVLLVGPAPGRLIESNHLLLNLNPPCALEDTSWIRPGKTAWDWWSGTHAEQVDFKPGMNTETMKHYIDFAAAHGLEYMQIDAGWYPWSREDRPDSILECIPEIDMAEITAHAAGKGVKVLLWVEWRSLDQRMDEALDLYAEWGVAGIKVDYMNRDDQEMVNFYERCVRKAAEHKMVVDFHGAYKPTGLRRTFPNLLTREGVMAMEYNKWSDRLTPEHDVTVPFTRMLAGPMDFTPGAFRNAARGRFEARDLAPMSQGTRAHQLAMFVVYESPLVMLADYPEAYENQPGFEFIERVPTVWDDTKVLGGEPAGYVAIARRKDDVWYLGAMTSWEARDLEIPLDFLEAAEYEARIFADGPDADREGTDLSVGTKRVRAADTLDLRLAPGGGAAVILTPLKADS